VTEADDETLLEGWASGDPKAGNALLERHFDALCRFFRTKAGDDVDDLIQRALQSCVEHRERLRDVTSFRAYLFAIARNELYDHFQRRLRQRIDPLASSVFDLGPTPSSLFGRDQRRERVLTALQRIPLELQTMLELHFWEQLTTAELADALGIPQGTVKSRLRRGKAALREELERLSKP
jgi:RNA polymerase sigma-70 factor (ECF subfamily)